MLKSIEMYEPLYTSLFLFEIQVNIKKSLFINMKDNLLRI